MSKSEISNLDLKIKLTTEYLNNGGYERIWDKGLCEDLLLVKVQADGKVNPDTVSKRVNAFMLTILASQLTPPIYSPNNISEYETTLQKSNYFNQINIDTIEHFDKIYAEYKYKKEYIFRGQKEAKWRLYSTLQRHWIMDKLKVKFESYQNMLEKMIDLGRTQHNNQYIKILSENHQDADNDIAVLSFLQHHGCPTPLLDWTYKFQNALFFAINGLDHKERKREIDDYFSVFFIEEKYFEKGSMRNLIYETIESSQEFALNRIIDSITQDQQRRTKMRDHFKGRKAIDISRIKGSGMIKHMLNVGNMIKMPATYFGDGKPDNIIFSLNNSNNINNQSGVFTWNADPAKPLELVVNEQYAEVNKLSNFDDNSEQNALCECFNINKKLADHIRNVLKADGITKELIYPSQDLSTWEIYKSCIS